MSRRWKWILGLAWLVLVLAGLFRLRFDAQILNLLPQELSSVKGLRIYEDHFANANELVIAVKGDNPEALEKAARDIALALRGRSDIVAEATWRAPWQEHPGEIAELIAYFWLNGRPETLASLKERLAPEALPTLLAQTKEDLATSLSPEQLAKLSYDPFRLLDVGGESSVSLGQADDLFTSKDRKFRLIFVQSRENLHDYRECKAWFEKIKATVPKVEGVETRYTGRPAFMTEISSSMEKDITSSVTGTLVIIGVLFYWAHRQFRPLLWLLWLLLLILISTLAIGGLIFQKLNVVSVGFAAILLGLSVDYGLVLYQEYLSDGRATVGNIRRSVGPSIIWAAATTAGAFFVLNLGGLPGLGQLGSLVGIGVVVAAIIMIFFFLTPLSSKPRQIEGSARAIKGIPTKSALVITIGVLLSAIFMMAFSPPKTNFSSQALRPGHSQAFKTLEEIKVRMERPREPLWLIFTGKDAIETGKKIEHCEAILNKPVASGELERATMPTQLFPRADRQRINRPLIREILKNEPAFAKAALDAGFTEDSLRLQESIFETWGRAIGVSLYLPINETSHWILERMLSHDEGNFIALGMVHPAEGQAQTWRAEVERAGALVAGWDYLGVELFGVLRRDFWAVAIPMILLVIGCLWFAYRNIAELLLSLFSLAFAGLLLILLMKLFGWSWNLMNLMAIPLFIGSGIDYSIHIQLALRRHGGNLNEVRRSIGKAIFLCAATTITGFGSLAWAGNAGLSSLGLICATGIGCALFTATMLLPVWWKLVHRKRPF